MNSLCFKLNRAYSFSLNSSNTGKFFRSWILKDCIKVQEKVKWNVKREIRTFHVVVVHWRQRNVHRSVMRVQSCCFANLNLLLFCRPRYRRPHRCLSFLRECLRWSHMTPSLKNSFRKPKEGRMARTLHALLEAVRYPNNQEPWFCTLITTYPWGTLEIPNNHWTSHIFWSAYHHYGPLPGWFFYHLTQEIQFS